MTLTKEQKLEILELLDELCIGAEIFSYEENDHGSAWNIRTLINGEKFRENIQKKIRETNV